MSQDPVDLPSSGAAVGSQVVGESSTTDVAKEQASGVKDTTVQAGQEVVQETRQQVSQVTAEAKDQAGDLLRQGVAEISSQVGQQQQRLAQSVHSIADELGSMASSSDQAGPMTGLAKDASGRAASAADWLENHEPRDILDGLRSFARRRPGTFLLGAAVAGVLVGRLTRGLAADAGSEGHSTGGSETRSSELAAPSGYSPATEAIGLGAQPVGGPPAGLEDAGGPAAAAIGDTAFDDTLPRGPGEGGLGAGGEGGLREGGLGERDWGEVGPR